MINFIKSLFTKSEDPNLDALRAQKTRIGNIYKALNEDEQIYALLRLADKSKADIAIALNMSLAKVDAIELVVLAKLKALK